MESGQIYPITLEFDHLAHTFKAGHKLRLIITGSNYPRFNRNMNTGGEMYPDLNIDTLVNPVIAQNTIFTNAQHPSGIELPIVDNTSSTFHPEEQNSLRVFPNPSGNMVTLQSDIALSYVYLYNSVGQIVWAHALSEVQQTQIQTQSLPNGIYWLAALTEKGSLLKKELVIQH